MLSVPPCTLYANGSSVGIRRALRHAEHGGRLWSGSIASGRRGDRLVPEQVLSPFRAAVRRTLEDRQVEVVHERRRL